MNNDHYHFLTGRLGQEPQLAYTRGGVPVCKLSLALDQKDNDKTIWKNVIVWGRLGESAKVLLKKGNHIFLEGIFKSNEYVDREGQRKVVEEFVANKVALSLHP